jgi:hypothetical protein
MYYGFTESESFFDPTILNGYKHHKVVIEKRGDGKGFWHIVILNIKDGDIKDTVDAISEALKPDWNAMFFNERILYAVFKDKIFKLEMKKKWKPSEYEEVKTYAKVTGVGDLEMNECFTHYTRLLQEE